MNFLKYKNSNIWWEWPEDGMIVFNVNGGWHEINENSEAFMEGTVIHANSWADLCKKVNYNPWASDDNLPKREMWIDPNGNMYDCGQWGAHESTAQKILEILYDDLEAYWDAGDKLIARGWIKVSAGPMGRYYHESGMYEEMTEDQYRTYQKWRIKYGIIWSI